MNKQFINDFSPLERLHSPKLRIMIGVKSSSVFFKTAFEIYIVEEGTINLEKKYTKLVEEHDFFAIIERY